MNFATSHFNIAKWEYWVILEQAKSEFGNELQETLNLVYSEVLKPSFENTR